VPAAGPPGAGSLSWLPDFQWQPDWTETIGQVRALQSKRKQTSTATTHPKQPRHSRTSPYSSSFSSLRSWPRSFLKKASCKHINSVLSLNYVFIPILFFVIKFELLNFFFKMNVRSLTFEKNVCNGFPHKYSLTAHFLSNAEVSNTKQTNFGPFFSAFWTNRYPHSWFWCFLSGERGYLAHFPAWLSTKKGLTKNQKITSLVVLTQLLTDFSMAKPNLQTPPTWYRCPRDRCWWPLTIEIKSFGYKVYLCFARLFYICLT